MAWTNFKRVLRTGFVNFWRNATISFASFFVMVIALFVITSLLLTSAASDSLLAILKDKVDINIYFKTNATEKDILDLQDKLKTLPEVKDVIYTSKEEALASFKDRHKDNSLILSSLDELNENPLGAILSVKAKDPSQYEGITKFLEGGDVAISADGSGVIDKVNFYQNKLVIDRLTQLIDSTEKIGFSITVIFALLAVAVIFNTIQLAIFNSREEISVMRLVGAGNWFIRGPFIVSGVMAGILAAIVTLGIFFPLTSYIGDKTQNFLSGINVYAYYKQNFFQLAAIILGTGISLGALSSYLSVRRYLHI